MSRSHFYDHAALRLCSPQALADKDLGVSRRWSSEVQLAPSLAGLAWRSWQKEKGAEGSGGKALPCSENGCYPSFGYSKPAHSPQPTGAARSAADHILIQQLLPTAGYGVYVQAQEIAEQSVPAVAQADGLQPGKQSALLFIEQAIEQEDGGLEFIGRSLEVGGMDGYRNGVSAAPGE